MRGYRCFSEPLGAELLRGRLADTKHSVHHACVVMSGDDEVWPEVQVPDRGLDHLLEHAEELVVVDRCDVLLELVLEHDTVKRFLERADQSVDICRGGRPEGWG